MKDIVKYEDFEKIEVLVGTILEVKINETRTWSLSGELQRIIKNENEAYLIGY